MKGNEEDSSLVPTLPYLAKPNNSTETKRFNEIKPHGMLLRCITMDFYSVYCLELLNDADVYNPEILRYNFYIITQKEFGGQWKKAVVNLFSLFTASDIQQTAKSQDGDSVKDLEGRSSSWGSQFSSS